MAQCIFGFSPILVDDRNKLVSDMFTVNRLSVAPKGSCLGPLLLLVSCLVSDKVVWQRLGLTGQCFRHKELLVGELVLWESLHGRRG